VSPLFAVPGPAPSLAAALDRIGREGLWTSKEAPADGGWPPGPLRVGLHGKSVRGVEAERAGGETRVRLFECSTEDDLRLGLRLTAAFAGETGTVRLDGGETVPASGLRARFDEVWIEDRVAEGPARLRALFEDRAGPPREEIVVPGLRCDVHVGRSLLAKLEPDSPGFGAALLERMRRIQWIEDEGYAFLAWYTARPRDGSEPFTFAELPRNAAVLVPVVDRLVVDGPDATLAFDFEDAEAVGGRAFAERVDEHHFLWRVVDDVNWARIVARAKERGIPVPTKRRGSSPRARASARRWWRFWERG
jgi:hypothetical protein